MLASVRAGRSEAVDQLFPLVYAELRSLAARSLRRERPDHTLQATALANEAYLRLVKQTKVEWKDRAHFFAIAAQAIRRILVDHARKRGCEKRGGGLERVMLHPDISASVEPSDDIVALDEALKKLALKDARKAKVVELRFFGGLTVEESAEVLGIGARSVERDWRYARAWLFREVHEQIQSEDRAS